MIRNIIASNSMIRIDMYFIRAVICFLSSSLSVTRTLMIKTQFMKLEYVMFIKIMYLCKLFLKINKRNLYEKERNVKMRRKKYVTMF